MPESEPAPQARSGVGKNVDIWGVPFDGRLMIAIASVLLGGFLRGFVGFGAALVIVPVLSLAYGPLVAIPTLTVMGIPTLLQLLPDAVRHSDRRIIGPMSAAILLSAPLGTWVLVSVPPALIKMVISGLVICLVGMLARGWKLDGDVSMPVLVLSGAAGGLVQGGGPVSAVHRWLPLRCRGPARRPSSAATCSRS